MIPGPSSSLPASLPRNPSTPIGPSPPALSLVEPARLGCDWPKAYVETSPPTTMGHVWGREGDRSLTFSPPLLQKSDLQKLSVCCKKRYLPVAMWFGL